MQKSSSSLFSHLVKAHEEYVLFSMHAYMHGFTSLHVFYKYIHVFSISYIGKGVDYGSDTSKIYNYTFHAGSTCASPDSNITITDDMISEDEESFHIRIMPFTLPFGVITSGPALFLIRYNDSKQLDYNCMYVLYLQTPMHTSYMTCAKAYHEVCIGKNSLDYVRTFQSISKF